VQAKIILSFTIRKQLDFRDYHDIIQLCCTSDRPWLKEWDEMVGRQAIFYHIYSIDDNSVLSGLCCLLCQFPLAKP
jgi:hypothetical protein